jgi:trimethylamine:corrinoid methyltransferase-like protein
MSDPRGGARGASEGRMVEQPAVQRRHGGRAARRELRAQPIALERRAVGPRLSGGRYRALSEGQVQTIHRAALDVLEQIGLSDAIPSCIELMSAAGGMLGADRRLRLPRALVEDVRSLRSTIPRASIRPSTAGSAPASRSACPGR